MDSPLLNISPLDGRYAPKTNPLRRFFSEHAFFYYRLKVEVAYFEALMNFLQRWTEPERQFFFREIHPLTENFSVEDSQHIKSLEKITNHDVKALEYYLREVFDRKGWGAFKEWIHFGLTSQDVNNVAIPLMLKDAVTEVLLPFLNDLRKKIRELGIHWQCIPMLARTHGQPASPTTLGKEWLVFEERLQKQQTILEHLPYPAKFGGATGNFNAHYVAFPDHDWIAFGDAFIQSLGLSRNRFTTQIDHYDMLAAHLDAWKRICVILKDFCVDQWLYISMEYFYQKIQKNEVGSSAMPHKVNPIDFENAEGNLGLAIALFEHLASKLPVSRLQRDLTDSTVLRNLGTPFAHLMIAMENIQRGIMKLEVNQEKIYQDLENNWAVVAEAIQTILRRENYPDPYNVLKTLTRTGNKITRETLHAFIDKLNIREEVKQELKAITPHNYTGCASNLKLNEE